MNGQRRTVDVFMVAGESSADDLGARLMRALSAERAVSFRGVGGPRMSEAGLTSLYPAHDLFSIGVWSVVTRLPILVRRFRETVDAIVSVDRSLLPSKAKVFSEDMDRRIVESGARELDSLMRGLNGGFIVGGGGGEPIRNPASYPTGKNFYGIDPDKVPKPASWALGVKLAQQMLTDYRAKHGR